MEKERGTRARLSPGGVRPLLHSPFFILNFAALRRDHRQWQLVAARRRTGGRLHAGADDARGTLGQRLLAALPEAPEFADATPARGEEQRLGRGQVQLGEEAHRRLRPDGWYLHQRLDGGVLLG